MKVSGGLIIDQWAVAHVALSIWVAATIHARWAPRWPTHLLLCAILSLGWETTEQLLHTLYAPTWAIAEHPINSWIMDPAANGVGWAIGALIGVRRRASISAPPRRRP